MFFSTYYSILAYCLFIVYCLLFVKIVRNEYEYQDKFLICVNVFGNKPFLILMIRPKAHDTPRNHALSMYNINTS